MPESSLSVRVIRDDEALPPAEESIFQNVGSSNIFYSRAWLENYRRCGVAAGDQLRLYALEEQQSTGVPLALVPVIYSRLYGAHPRARVLHFLQPEALDYSPLLAAHGLDSVTVLQRVFEFLRSQKPAYDVLRFSPLRPGTPLSSGLISVLRRTSHALQIYQLPQEYYANTAGMTAGDYLSSRQHGRRGSLDTLEQTHRDDEDLTFRLISAIDEVDHGWRDYQKILDENESDPEPELPDYLPNAMRVAAATGALRLGFIHLAGEPVAVQLWVVSGGIARCLRAWSVLRHEALALDDRLTEWLAVRLIERDKIQELSFGALNDVFIPNWAPDTREQFGLAAFNLSTWRGMKGAGRHVSAAVVSALIGRYRRNG